MTGEAARGIPGASSSGLGAYAQGTVQGAVGAVPGVQEDQFANVILQGGKVKDTVFSYDAVPVPQALIAEPGGNVVGAQLPTTGLGYTQIPQAESRLRVTRASRASSTRSRQPVSIRRNQ